MSLIDLSDLDPIMNTASFTQAKHDPLDSRRALNSNTPELEKSDLLIPVEKVAEARQQRVLDELAHAPHEAPIQSTSAPIRTTNYTPSQAEILAPYNNPDLPVKHIRRRSSLKASLSLSVSPGAEKDIWDDFQTASTSSNQDGTDSFWNTNPIIQDSPGPSPVMPTFSNISSPGSSIFSLRQKLEQARTDKFPFPLHSNSLPLNVASKPKLNHAWSTDNVPHSPSSISSPTVSPIRLLGVRDGVNRVLDEDIAEAIRPSLPPRLRLASKWNLLYSLDQHGISINTMYEKMKTITKASDSGIVLVVKDTNGSIFGAYINEALKDTKGYYGDGSCFLWSSTPFAPTDFRVGSFVNTYKWTGRNNYFVLSESNFFSIGGGDGKFGLWIDSHFEKGFSGKCPCFGNEPLTKKEFWTKGGLGQEEAKFNVYQFEAWGIVL